MSRAYTLILNCKQTTGLCRHVLSAAAAAAVLSHTLPATATVTTTNYSPTIGAIANPGRGFYRHPGDCDKRAFDQRTLEAYRRNQKISLVMCIFYLERFKLSDIDEPTLTLLTYQASTVRKAGLKMILRFAYTKSQSGDDASPERVQGHLAQLQTFLRTNSDVIAVMESGFVGAWGEGYYTQHFGPPGQELWDERRKVVDKLLEIFPATRSKVSVRTPRMKIEMYGATPATAQDRTAGTPIGRVGHHNDCFLRNSSDMGTYRTVPDDRAYQARDTAQVVMGGETCFRERDLLVEPFPSYSKCPNALLDLSKYHYTYLNRDQYVVDRWIADGCMAEIEQRLGYRFQVVSAASATTVTRNTRLPFEMKVRNAGWASAMTDYTVRLVLRNKATGAIYRFPVGTTRSWQPGTTTTVGALDPLSPRAVLIPSSMPVGRYDLLLSIEDPAKPAWPAYAVRLANPGLWEELASGEPSTGLNRLLREVEVQ